MRAPVAVALFCLATPALAGPQCTDLAEDEWLTEAQMRARIDKLGHTVEVFKKTDGNCYEIYGRDTSGNRIEVYFHPVTGAVVKASSL